MTALMFHSWPARGGSGRLSRLRAAAPPLFWTGLALLALSLPTLLLAGLDPRLFQGVSVWLKPWKFQLSVGVFLLTLALFMCWLPPWRQHGRAARALAWVAVASGVFEVAYITWQGAWGLASHFNTGSALGAALYALMGVGAVSLSATALALAVLIARTTDYGVPPAFKLSIVLGLALTFLLGTGFGGYLSAQAAGHWVGGSLSDAGGLPVVKWSRDGGDLRVAHFFGVHAMHFIPALGAALLALRLDARRARLAVWAFAALFTAFSVWTFVQALDGQAFVQGSSEAGVVTAASALRA